VQLTAGKAGGRIESWYQMLPVKMILNWSQTRKMFRCWWKSNSLEIW